VERALAAIPGVVAEMRRAGVAYDNRGAFVSQDELRQLLAAGKPPVILDVRHVIYPHVMIPGSIHVPVWSLKRRMKELDRDADLVVVCYQGDVISPEAQELLKQHGFKNVRVLKGGIFSYAGHPPY
jgi:rhodanese-related sulfurtransferase